MASLFKKPYLNSLWAELYILAIVSLAHAFTKPNAPDNFLDPVAALSLFVLSAAVMGYLFLGEPVQLCI